MGINQIDAFLESHGYKQKKYGFVKKGKDVSHGVTIFPKDQFQIWGWYTHMDDQKVYDTGIVEITDYNLFVQLILLFDQHSKI